MTYPAQQHPQYPAQQHPQYPAQQHPQYPAQQYPQQQRQAPAVPAAPAPSANDALMGGGGPSYPGVQFQQPGDGVRGAVVLAF